MEMRGLGFAMMTLERWEAWKAHQRAGLSWLGSILHRYAKSMNKSI